MYPKTEKTTQNLDNRSFDQVFQVYTHEPVEFDGTSLLRKQTNLLAKKITSIGDVTYIASAPVGTSESTAGWQVKKIATSGANTTITWADGNSNFDNEATDLTSLSYS